MLFKIDAMEPAPKSRERYKNASAWTSEVVGNQKPAMWC
jgi:hypothetical protein